jgi:hypothetical protein
MGYNGLDYEFIINDHYSDGYRRTIKFIEQTRIGDTKTYIITHSIKSSKNRFGDVINFNGKSITASQKTEIKNGDWYIGNYIFPVSREFFNNLTKDNFIVSGRDFSFTIDGDKFNDFVSYINWIEYKYDNSWLK